jgi:hypothetical protein
VAEVVNARLWVEPRFKDRALEHSPPPPAIAPVIPETAVWRGEEEG